MTHFLETKTGRYRSAPKLNHATSATLRTLRHNGSEVTHA